MTSRKVNAQTERFRNWPLEQTTSRQLGFQQEVATTVLPLAVNTGLRALRYAEELQALGCIMQPWHEKYRSGKRAKICDSLFFFSSEERLGGIQMPDAACQLVSA